MLFKQIMLNFVAESTQKRKMNFLFISYLLNGDLNGLKLWLAAVGIMALLPILASVFDLYTGIRKSKVVGNFKTTSYGLKKTRDKDLVYLLFYLLFAMVDSCLSFILPFPLFCIFCAVAEVAIEAWSVHENLFVIKKDVHDPIEIMKAISSTYGINDPEKIEAVFEKIRESKDVGEYPKVRKRGARKGAAQ